MGSPGFSNPIDICNRGMMHIGAVRIDPTLGFTEISRQASAASFVYDKLRRAELRANYWRFAIRKAPLRAVDAATMFLAATLWSAQTTYYRASVVTDQSGTAWISNSPDNLNNQPGQSAQWDFYAGPLNVPQLDLSGQTLYFAGELVYTTPGDGTYQVFQALQSNNNENPLVPDQWVATATYLKDQIAQFSPAWSGITTYSQGQTVTYTDGNTYASLVNANLNQVPPNAGTAWVALPVSTATVTPTAVLEWSATTTYALGAIIDLNGKQYVCVAATSLKQPPATTPAAWAQLTLGVLYMSLIDVNVNNEPDLAPILWASGTTYAATNKVVGSDGFIYQSIGSGNVGHNPVSDGGVHWTATGTLCPWTTLNLSGSGSLKWLKMPSAVLTEQNFTYPIGAGPSEDSTTRNVFRLPANYLRAAPQDPRLGGTSLLGAPSGLGYTDWEYDGNFIISIESGPIVYRFVADFASAPDMDDMFCEALGARIGLECCEEITQKTTKKEFCAKEYQKWISEAGRVNGIEAGPVESPTDDYLACRI